MILMDDNGPTCQENLTIACAGIRISDKNNKNKKKIMRRERMGNCGGRSATRRMQRKDAGCRGDENAIPPRRGGVGVGGGERVEAMAVVEMDGVVEMEVGIEAMLVVEIDVESELEAEIGVWWRWRRRQRRGR